MSNSKENFTFTVGKLDAGMAILIGERAHLIEFPSVLLPRGVTSGSIVNIAVHRNYDEEEKQRKEFWDLQREIYSTFGVASPKPPRLELRNVTQTSVTLEWPSLQLATAKLRSLDIYKNNQRLASIPSPLQNTSTKLSGLEVNTEFSFHLILRTTAGTFPSNVIRTRTHTMTDTSGISVCFGIIEDEDGSLVETAKDALKAMRARWSEKIQIETTHFVCTTPALTPQGSRASGGVPGATGVEYQKALSLSIPVVHPHWILACHQEKKMVPISGYYLGATAPPVPQSFSRPTSLSQAPSSIGSPKPAPVPVQISPVSPKPQAATPPSTFVNQSAAPSPGPLPVVPVNAAESDEEDEVEEEEERSQKRMSVPRPTNGVMKKDFKFPPQVPEKEKAISPGSAAPAPVEIPPPSPVEKEKKLATGRASGEGEGDEDVGETEEVDLT